MKKLLLILVIPFLSFGQIVTEDCNSIPEIGPCFANIITYYFNQNTYQCEESYWGGCGGLVAFWTLESCQNNCENNSLIDEIHIKKTLIKTINLIITVTSLKNIVRW